MSDMTPIETYLADRRALLVEDSKYDLPITTISALRNDEERQLAVVEAAAKWMASHNDPRISYVEHSSRGKQLTVALAALVGEPV